MSFNASVQTVLSSAMLLCALSICLLGFAACHSHQPSLLTSKSHVHDVEHIGHHLQGIADVNKMAEDELRFHYFKLHDSDQNNKLDGCELIKSLLHFHEEHMTMETTEQTPGTRVFDNIELEMMIDPIMNTDDINLDGFIDYPEFVAAQKSRGF